MKKNKDGRQNHYGNRWNHRRAYCFSSKGTVKLIDRFNKSDARMEQMVDELKESADRRHEKVISELNKTTDELAYIKGRINGK